MMSIASIDIKTTKKGMRNVARLEKEISREEKVVLKQKSDALMNISFQVNKDNLEGNISIGSYADAEFDNHAVERTGVIIHDRS